ncbi:phospholipid carrier-dependent glycosyltransferase [archaeon]|nr:phospholipid carrier-dependent glycosyltransferase [archaeon]MBL7057004.1 phospholipid carrier-dependent glycosyltransferase [Candidatus Woesearchaeota archaeon]
MGVCSKKELKIFITFFLIYVIFAQSIAWNENTRLDLTLAIVDEGTFAIDSYFENTGDRVTFNDHYYTDKAPGMSFLGIPSYFVYKQFFGPPTVGEELYAPLSKSFASALFIVIIFTSALLGALSVVLVYRVSNFFTKRKLHKNLIVLIYGLGTLIFVYSRIFMSHTAAAFFSFLCFYLILKANQEKSKKKYYFLLAGLSGGFGLITDYTVLIVLIISFLMIFLGTSKYKLVFTSKLKHSGLFILGFILIFSLLIFYNQQVFNKSIAYPYSYVDSSVWTDSSYELYGVTCEGLSPDDTYRCKAIGTQDVKLCEEISDFNTRDSCFLSLAFSLKEIDVCNNILNKDNSYFCKSRVNYDKSFCNEIVDQSIKKECVGELSIIKKVSNIFFLNKEDVPLKMFRLSFFPYRGLFFYFPILIFSIIGLFFMFKKYKFESLAIAGLFLVLLWFSASLTVWWGGYAFGPRHMTPLMPFLMIPLLFSLKKIKLRYIMPFIVISIFFCVLSLQIPEEAGLGKTVDNLTPFGNPLFDHYLPSFLESGPRTILLEKLSDVFMSNMGFKIAIILSLLVWHKELYRLIRKKSFK